MPEPIPETERAGHEAPILAAIFDLDGVLTRTASVHETAWRRAFEGLLSSLAREARFSTQDYLRHVDGKPRYDGARDFLEARGVAIPFGAPGDPPGYGTVCAVANLKTELFAQLLHDEGVEVFDDALERLDAWRDAGLRTAIVSSSRHALPVLEAAGLAARFDARVDGVVGDELGLPGKPAPDYFLEAARRLGVPPSRAMVIEDAISGVEAGRRGGFGLVVGVSRHGRDEELRAAGADRVVHVLTEIGARPSARGPRASAAAGARSAEPA